MNLRDTDGILALYRFYINSADHELVELKITRSDVLDLIRILEGDVSGYHETALLTIARQLIKSYVAGIGEALK